MTSTAALPVRRFAAAILAAAMALVAAPSARAASELVSVVATSGDLTRAVSSVRAAGGIVDEMLPIVDGVAARVPAHELSRLSKIVSVVADRPVRMQSNAFGGSLVSAYPAEVGAPALWHGGNTGEGVSVALVDTGIADVPDLRGRVVARADVSGERSTTDGYGHGTFMAGLIAGDGTSSGGRYVGVAPGADLVSVKVADRDGNTNLSKVLHGVQLVKSAARKLNIRVALLALSSESPLPPDLDPLSIALRRTWASGVLVVVPAGNDGPQSGTIASPGEDPVLLTVGSVDDRGTADVLDDAVSEWTARGVTRWGDPKPDVAAPGEHLISLRAPGSTVDKENPGSVVESAYFRGSGTSMSAAVAAGAAALLFAARPELGPDQAKFMLMGGAHPIPAGDADSVGAGVVDAAYTVTMDAPRGLPGGADDDDDDDLPSAGGKWKGKKGSQHWDRDGDGDDDRFGDWGGRQWAEERWEGRQWAGRQWAGRQWAGRQWAYAKWLGRQWAGRQWAGQSWSGRQWSGQTWSGRQWTREEWLGRQWSGQTWSGRQWSGQTWSGRQWSGRQWSGRQWSGRQWSSTAWG